MEYKKNVLKIYKDWTLYLHENQSYLGRCYLWYNFDKPVDLFEIKIEVFQDLFHIVSSVKKALSTNFNPDIFNYASLNNITRHLHFHIIPRYKKPINFYDQVFVDLNRGANYSPYQSNFSISQNTRNKIIEKIRYELNKE